MKGIREIKIRIKAIQGTAKITRAMQLVAASKMKRAQDKAKSGRPYALLLAQILSSLIDNAEDLTHPLIKKREVKHRGVIVVSTDKGLLGALNTNLFRLIIDMEPSTRFISIGRKATQFLSRSKRDLLADFSVSDKVNFSEVRPAVEFAIQAYKEGKIDTLEILFPKFINTLRQDPQVEQLLPLDNLDEELKALQGRLAMEKQEDLVEQREMLFEPDSKTLLAELPDLFVKQEIYQIILEAKASEQSSRMVAMKKATDNAKDLVRSLSLEYNKARQAAITQEILEIAAAAINTAKK